jgi:hypothetical protein
MLAHRRGSRLDFVRRWIEESPYGRNVARDGELYWNDVDVAAACDGRIVA